MNLVYAAAIALIFGAGVFLLLSRHLLRMVFGVMLISGAGNLVLLLAGRIGASSPPVIPPGETALPPGAANPVPQALILTAIVIGFGLSALLVSLAFSSWQSARTLDGRRFNAAEQLGSPDAERPGGNPA